jgi:hypothetical protein
VNGLYSFGPEGLRSDSSRAKLAGLRVKGLAKGVPIQRMVPLQLGESPSADVKEFYSAVNKKLGKGSLREKSV